MKIVCISDTHGEHESLHVPSGDVLVHAGDITAHGTRADYHAFIDWFAKQPHTHKIFIAGNHDAYLEQYPEEALASAQAQKLVYLNDSGVQLDNVRFWGSPITPQFHDWSFMRNSVDIQKHWSLIPDDTHILITHGPVWGVLDEVERSADVTEHTGCRALAQRVQTIKPAYHVFGHIHEGYGKLVKDETSFLNVSSMNRHYKIQNQAVEFEFA